MIKKITARFTKTNSKETVPTPAPAPRPLAPDAIRTFEITPSDPLTLFLQNNPGVFDAASLNFDSPMLRSLKSAGVRLAVPLVSQGELVGLLNLGPRMSEQDYSTDDRGLLNNLAGQAGPAVRVAQLVRQQQIEARELERFAQELQVARLIQQTLLPKELPKIDGWQVAAYYQPARAVGGDFYDFYARPDGRLVIVIGDVTDKGVPAALVMATTRAILRGASRRMLSPGAALERSNDLICPEIPPSMFVTCLYAILDPATGKLQYANAGHDLPYRRCSEQVEELRATGMPLGLMPGMKYEEKETTLEAGDSLLLYTDGLVEAHNPQRAMYGFPRLQKLLGVIRDHEGTALIRSLLDDLASFTEPGWEQEDDVTLVAVRHDHNKPGNRAQTASEWVTIADFTIPSEPGNERIAMKEVAQAINPLGLPIERVERLKTAVAEATMNAIEYGNKNRADLVVTIRVVKSADQVAVRITDQGGRQEIPVAPAPDLEAKLAGLQSPRGWGLFLIKNLVDEMNIIPSEDSNTFELVINLEASQHGN